MTENFSRFRQQRDFGEILSVTFKFVREEYKSLFSYIFKIVGPFFVMLIAALVYYTYTGAKLYTFQGDKIVALILFLLALLLFYSVLYGTVLHYIKSYMLHQGKPVGAEIRQGVQSQFLKLMLLFFILAIFIFVGMVFFIIPGIYIMVPLTFAAPFLVFKNTGVGNSISRCFDLVKDHWWQTFGYLIVLSILVYLIGLIFQLPLIIYTMVKIFISAQHGTLATNSITHDWLFLSLNVLASIVQYTLAIIIIIGLSFMFYNLDERKNLTGTYEIIDNLGN